MKTDRWIFYARVRAWLNREFNKRKSKIVMFIAPGHKASSNPSGFVHEILDGISHPKIT